MKDETGSLTMSPDVAGYDGKELTIVTDIRYPATFTQDRVTAVLDKFGAPYTLLHCQAPLYNDKGNFLITALQKVYERHTGEKGEPVAIGGGTYARALQNGAAFGPLFPGAPSTIHQGRRVHFACRRADAVGYLLRRPVRADQVTRTLLPPSKNAHPNDARF